MAPVIWGVLGVGGGGLGLWALLLIVTSRRDGVRLTRRQLPCTCKPQHNFQRCARFVVGKTVEGGVVPR
jgi:hypothetical protein